MWLCGLMDKASDFESGDSRFKSWQSRFCHEWNFIFACSLSLHVLIILKTTKIDIKHILQISFTFHVHVLYLSMHIPLVLSYQTRPENGMFECKPLRNGCLLSIKSSVREVR